MGQVVVTVNGRAFPLNCADGEEPRIRRLAQYVDGKVGEFVKMHGQIGEARLILLAALVIALRVAHSRASRDLVIALGLAIGTSLLVNDSATYELVGGVATLAAVAHFKPMRVPIIVPAFARMQLPGEPVPNEARQD